ncbi:adhesion G protein-coupled receptor E3-like [Engraulis encrasicolus]|uniref:adhesion G protein-coupled receptor E3-like n=1 Tax=Engraulis encrasicolus TaxID=184585 RepID=UPI002FD05CB3
MCFSVSPPEGDVLSIGPNASLSAFPQLKLPSADVYLDIDLEGVALNNNGSASVALVSYSDMLDLLSADLFRPNVTTVKKSLLSRVVSATLEDVTDANLSSSVNFTLRHIVSRSQGNLSCVYWEEGEGEWSDEDCSVTESNSTHTICSCTHLSTFSLILHAEEFAPDLVLLLLNVVAGSLGLLCLLAAVVTFALCRKNPAASDPARLHMALCLLLAQLLFLNIQHQRRAGGDVRGAVVGMMMMVVAVMMMKMLKMVAMMGGVIMTMVMVVTDVHCLLR